MARFPDYSKKPFSPSQNFLARDPAGSGQVIRVQGQSILDAAVQEILDRGDIVQAVDTLTEAKTNDYASGAYVLTGGNTIALDGGQAIYRVSDPGSGGIAMDNGNELVLTFAPGVETFSDVSQISSNPGTFDKQQKSLLGWHPDSDVGGGILYWDASKPKSEHNGGTVFSPTVPWTTTTADYLNGVGETDPSGSGCWVRVNVEYVTPEMFGAVGDGVVDDTASLQAIDGFMSIWNKTYLFDSITYAQNVIIEVNGSIVLNSPSSLNAKGILLQGAGSRLEVFGSFDGSNTSRSLVSIEADDCIVKLFDVKNVNANADSTTFTSCIEVNSAANSVIRVKAKDVTNTGQANDSVPRIVTVQGTSTNYKVEEIDAQDSTSGLIVGSSVDYGACDSLKLDRMADNGIYTFGGDIDIDQIIYRGNEEAVVVASGLGTVTNINSLIVSDSPATAIRLQSAGDVNVESLLLNGTTAGAVGLRSSNVETGRVSINSIKGTFTPSTFIECRDTAGTLEYLSINNVDVVINYDQTVMTSRSDFVEARGAKGVSFKNWNVKLVDVDDILVFGNYFFSYLPTTNLVEPSFWEHVNIFTTQSDGVTYSAGNRYRGFNIAQDLVNSVGVKWEANVGPYANSPSGADQNNRESLNQIPVVGAWKAGDDYELRGAAVAPFRARCTVSGTPGTWVAY